MLKGIISATIKTNNMNTMAVIYNMPVDCRIWQSSPASANFCLRRNNSTSRRAFLLPKIVICGFNGVLKCNGPRWSTVEEKKGLGN